MSNIEQTQNTNGQGSKTGTIIMPIIPEELASRPQSSNSNARTAINQDSFSFKTIHSLRFIFQAAFSTIILIFCLYQLSISKDSSGKNDSIYWGGVTGILALWMPSPSSSGTPPTNQPNFETAGAADKRH